MVYICPYRPALWCARPMTGPQAARSAASPRTSWRIEIWGGLRYRTGTAASIRGRLAEPTLYPQGAPGKVARGDIVGALPEDVRDAGSSALSHAFISASLRRNAQRFRDISMAHSEFQPVAVVLLQGLTPMLCRLFLSPARPGRILP